MISSFLSLAVQSPTRQAAFRRTCIAHLVVLGGIVSLLTLRGWPSYSGLILSQALLIMGIVEGAILIGWRLTQMPKSQSLEFLLVSPLRPRWVLIGEAMVGILRLSFVTLAGLPVLAMLVGGGQLLPWDVLPLLMFPLTWGTITGMLLTVWAYEPTWIRRWGERLVMALILLYLVVGVLAGEKLRTWLQQLPDVIGSKLFYGLIAFRDYNPFGVMRTWMTQEGPLGWERLITIQLIAMGVLLLMIWRASSRLQAHFHERHYQPNELDKKQKRSEIDNQPLTWWAVKRVSEYSGRSNLYLAGGFAVLYAFYTVAGSHWPSWMGRSVFVICDRVAGPMGLATALIVLAAVPAAFQYGLWDSSIQNRCKRLELLLLTKLDSRDYWNAAASAAWKRGRGYFIVSFILWMAALFGHKATVGQVLASFACGGLLWCLYFTIGFRAFSHGVQANGLGMVLTVGLPLLALGCSHFGLTWLVSLIPPGSMHAAGRQTMVGWFLGPMIMAGLTLWLTKKALATCETDLRRWYDQHSGQKVMA